MQNISQQAKSSVIQAGEKYIIVAGGSLQSNAATLKNELYIALKEPLWDPLREMALQYKDYKKFRIPAIKKANKIITEKLICDATNKVKTEFQSNWNWAKKYFYTDNKLALVIGYCNA